MHRLALAYGENLGRWMRCELDYYPCPVKEREVLFRVAPASHPQHQTIGGMSSRVCVPTHRYAGRRTKKNPRLPHHEQSLWPAVLASRIRPKPAYGWLHPSCRSVPGRDERELRRREKFLLPLYPYDAAHSNSDSCSPSSAPSPPKIPPRYRLDGTLYQAKRYSPYSLAAAF